MREERAYWDQDASWLLLPSGEQVWVKKGDQVIVQCDDDDDEGSCMITKVIPRPWVQ